MRGILKLQEPAICLRFNWKENAGGRDGGTDKIGNIVGVGFLDCMVQCKQELGQVNGDGYGL